jgi:hypothetical protein
MAERYVEFGRWDEAHRAVLLRLMNIESQLHDLSGAEQVHRSLEDRLAAIEQQGKADEAESSSRRERMWTVVIVLVGSFVLPVAVSVVLTYLHLRSTH